MKKGQKVRVLADNRVGIIVDSHFINWGGKRWVQHQVRFPNTRGEAPWFPAERLGNVVEKCSITITDDSSVSVSLVVARDHDKKNMTVVADRFDAPKESLSFLMFAYLAIGMKCVVPHLKTTFDYED